MADARDRMKDAVVDIDITIEVPEVDNGEDVDNTIDATVGAYKVLHCT